MHAAKARDGVRFGGIRANGLILPKRIQPLPPVPDASVRYRFLR